MNNLGHQVGTICVCVKEVCLPTGRQVGGCVCVYVCVVVCECANSAVCVLGLSTNILNSNIYSNSC